jgi:hypothetical protein
MHLIVVGGGIPLPVRFERGLVDDIERAVFLERDKKAPTIL